MAETTAASILPKVKLSLRVINDVFDEEITNLIEAAVVDLGFGGVTTIDLADPVILQAVTTYVKLHFGEPDEYDRLKKSYDEQKAQLGTATGYTTWEA